MVISLFGNTADVGKIGSKQSTVWGFVSFSPFLLLVPEIIPQVDFINYF